MAPQQLVGAVFPAPSPYSAPPVAALADAIGRLEQIEAYAETHEPRGQHDGLACFSSVLHAVLCRVWEGVHIGTFDHPEFLAQLSVVLANRYLGALQANVVAASAVPDAWSALFERRSDAHVTQLQFAAAGVNAQVNFDLPLAVVDTCARLGCSPGSAPVLAACHELTRIYAEEMRATRTRFEHRWERLIEPAVLARVTAKINDWTVIADRAIACEAAQRLWELRSQRQAERAFVDRLDTIAAGLSRGVLIPVL
ncbi:MAG TPA: DUF5995 family protein [Actinomycetota bacterium]|nr:DUF5995 family protein [Actinomycetota bacterium]